MSLTNWIHQLAGIKDDEEQALDTASSSLKTPTYSAPYQDSQDEPAQIQPGTPTDAPPQISGSRFIPEPYIAGTSELTSPRIQGSTQPDPYAPNQAVPGGYVDETQWPTRPMDPGNPPPGYPNVAVRGNTEPDFVPSDGIYTPLRPKSPIQPNRSVQYGDTQDASDPVARALDLMQGGGQRQTTEGQDARGGSSLDRMMGQIAQPDASSTQDAPPQAASDSMLKPVWNEDGTVLGYVKPKAAAQPFDEAAPKLDDSVVNAATGLNRSLTNGAVNGGASSDQTSTSNQGDSLSSPLSYDDRSSPDSGSPFPLRSQASDSSTSAVDPVSAALDLLHGGAEAQTTEGQDRREKFAADTKPDGVNFGAGLANLGSSIYDNIVKPAGSAAAAGIDAVGRAASQVPVVGPMLAASHQQPIINNALIRFSTEKGRMPTHDERVAIIASLDHDAIPDWQEYGREYDVAPDRAAELDAMPADERKKAALSVTSGPGLQQTQDSFNLQATEQAKLKNLPGNTEEEQSAELERRKQIARDQPWYQTVWGQTASGLVAGTLQDIGGHLMMENPDSPAMQNVGSKVYRAGTNFILDNPDMTASDALYPMENIPQILGTITDPHSWPTVAGKVLPSTLRNAAETVAQIALARAGGGRAGLVGVATKLPIASIFITESGNTFNSLREAGMDPSKAQAVALTAGLAKTYVEFFPWEAVREGIGARLGLKAAGEAVEEAKHKMYVEFAKEVGMTMIDEGAEEGIQNGIDNAAQKLADPEHSLFDGMGQAIFFGGLGGGVGHVAFHGVEAGMHAVRQRLEARQTAADRAGAQDIIDQAVHSNPAVADMMDAAVGFAHRMIAERRAAGSNRPTAVQEVASALGPILDRYQPVGGASDEDAQAAGATSGAQATLPGADEAQTGPAATFQAIKRPGGPGYAVLRTEEGGTPAIVSMHPTLAEARTRAAFETRQSALTPVDRGSAGGQASPSEDALLGGYDRQGQGNAQPDLFGGSPENASIPDTGRDTQSQQEGATTVSHSENGADAAAATDEQDVAAPAQPAPSAAEGTEGKTYDYSSTQLNLPDDLASDVTEFAKQIPDDALADDGRENEPHVTVKYGLETGNANAVRDIVESHGPIQVTLGRVSIFPASETGGQFDVIKADVHSPDLHDLNAQLAKLPNGDTHPVYQPHVTIAYVRPGMGAQFVGSRALEGKTATISSLTFSGKDGQQTAIPLRGGAATEDAARPNATNNMRAESQTPSSQTEVGHPANSGVTDDERSMLQAIGTRGGQNGAEIHSLAVHLRRPSGDILPTLRSMSDRGLVQAPPAGTSRGDYVMLTDAGRQAITAPISHSENPPAAAPEAPAGLAPNAKVTYRTSKGKDVDVTVVAADGRLKTRVRYANGKEMVVANASLTPKTLRQVAPSRAIAEPTPVQESGTAPQDNTRLGGIAREINDTVSAAPGTPAEIVRLATEAMTILRLAGRGTDASVVGENVAYLRRTRRNSNEVKGARDRITQAIRGPEQPALAEAATHASTSADVAGHPTHFSEVTDPQQIHAVDAAAARAVADATDQTETVDLTRGGHMPGVGPAVFGQPHHSDSMLQQIAQSEPVQQAHAVIGDTINKMATDAKRAGLIPEGTRVSFGGFALGHDFGAFSNRSTDGARLVIYVNLHHTVARHTNAVDMAQELSESIAHEIAHAEIAGHPTRLDQATGQDISEVDALAAKILQQAQGAARGFTEVMRGVLEHQSVGEPRHLATLQRQNQDIAGEDTHARERTAGSGDEGRQSGTAVGVRPGATEGGRTGASAARGVRAAPESASERAGSGRAGSDAANSPGAATGAAGERQRIERAPSRDAANAAGAEGDGSAVAGRGAARDSGESVGPGSRTDGDRPYQAAQAEAVPQTGRDAESRRVGADGGDQGARSDAAAGAGGEHPAGSVAERGADGERADASQPLERGTPRQIEAAKQRFHGTRTDDLQRALGRLEEEIASGRLAPRAQREREAEARDMRLVLQDRGADISRAEGTATDAGGVSGNVAGRAAAGGELDRAGGDNVGGVHNGAAAVGSEQGAGAVSPASTETEVSGAAAQTGERARIERAPSREAAATSRQATESGSASGVTASSSAASSSITETTNPSGAGQTAPRYRINEQRPDLFTIERLTADGGGSGKLERRSFDTRAKAQAEIDRMTAARNSVLAAVADHPTWELPRDQWITLAGGQRTEATVAFDQMVNDGEFSATGGSGGMTRFRPTAATAESSQVATGQSTVGGERPNNATEATRSTERGPATTTAEQSGRDHGVADRAGAQGQPAEAGTRTGAERPATGVRGDENEVSSGSRQDVGGAERTAPGRSGERGVQGESTELTDNIQRPPAATGQAPAPSSLSAGQDAVFDPRDDALREKSAPRRFDRNLEALELLVKLTREQRPATPAEQKIMARYSGFGDTGFNEAFPATGEPKPGIWADRRARLKSALSALYPEGDEAARAFKRIEASRVNAMYTTPEVIASMWRGLQRLGVANLQRPRVLEPSSGSGRFLGLMPSSIASKARKALVELDTATGRLARALFPASFVQITGFQDAVLPNDGFDVVISNVPFSSNGVTDRDWPRSMRFLTKPLHNYFFAKSLDKVRPGGVIAFVTSRYTMDGTDETARAFRTYMAEHADLLAAVRLPSGAFPDTKVVTDIIFLQKRDPQSGPGSDDWVDTVNKKVATTREHKDWRGTVTSIPTEIPFSMNAYYEANPRNVLGTHDAPPSGGLYGGNEYTVTMTDDKWLNRLNRIMDRLPENVVSEATTPAATVPDMEQTEFAARTSKPGGYYLDKDGTLMVARLDGRRVSPTAAGLNELAEKRVRAMMGIRDRAQRLLELQASGATDTALEAAQHDLAAVYDPFVRTYGPLNDTRNAKLMQTDPDGGLLRSLEVWSREIGKAFPSSRPSQAAIDGLKAAIFSKRVTAVGARPETAGTAHDAMMISLNENGGLDWERMAGLTGQTAEQLQDALLAQGVVYENPEGDFEPSDQYLSGPVRDKLRKAEAAAQADPRFARNVEALKAVVPTDVTPGDIAVGIGAPWVPVQYLNQFAQEVLGLSHRTAGSNLYEYVPETGSYVRQAEDWGIGTSLAASEEWSVEHDGHRYFNPVQLLDAALAGKTLVAYDYDDKVRIKNDTATQVAKDKVDKLRERFGEWIWEDTSRAHDLAARYNDALNGSVARQYDGSHLTFPGSNPAITLRAHQKNAVWRVVQEGTTLLAHEVGFGKTYEMIASAMELRRLGLSKRNLFVLKNGTLEQFANDFRKMYPQAKLLVEDGTLTKSRRGEFMARIATGDWDAVLIQQSKFTLLPVKQETQIKYAEQRIADLQAAILARRELDDTPSGRDLSQKQLQDAIDKEQAKIDRLQDDLKNRQDSDVFFEDLGIDSLFVDEADQYRRLPFVTKRDQVKGIPRSSSQRAPDMQMKTRIVAERNGGRGVVFATGTPISNTIAEVWIMMKYLMPERLEAMGFGHFDAWADTFGQVENDFAPNPAGVYQPVTRFASFRNAPELAAIWQSVADVMMANDAPEMVAKRPKLIGGEREGDRILEISPKTPALEQMMDGFQSRLEAIKAMSPWERSQKGADNHLSVYNDARSAAVDVRLVDPRAPEEPAGKLTRAANNIYAIWQAEAADKGTQLVFLDFGTPKPVRTTEEAPEGGDIEDPSAPEELSEGERRAAAAAYTRLKDRLVARGIPAEQIGLASETKNKAEFEALMGKVRDGTVRVLIGSTEKMGAGVNVQDRLAALHHINPPWNPRDVEQREGRIIRQGNKVYGPEVDKNDNVTDPGRGVRVYQYVTKGSFDELSWQVLESKARGIKQILRRHVTERQIEDAGDIVESFATAKAAASGRPEAVRLVKVMNELDKMGAIRAAWQSGKRTAQIEINASPKFLAHNNERLAKYQADAKTLADHPSDDLTVGKTVHTERAAANAALSTVLARIANTDSSKHIEIGSYRGFTLVAWRAGDTMENGVIMPTVTVALDGEGSYAQTSGIPLNALVGKSTADVATRIKNATGRFGQLVTEQQAFIAQHQARIAAYQERLTKPFEYEHRYQTLLAERANLEKVLATAPSDEAPPDGATEAEIEPTLAVPSTTEPSQEPNLTDYTADGSQPLSEAEVEAVAFGDAPIEDAPAPQEQPTSANEPANVPAPIETPIEAQTPAQSAPLESAAPSSEGATPETLAVPTPETLAVPATPASATAAAASRLPATIHNRMRGLLRLGLTDEQVFARLTPEERATLAAAAREVAQSQRLSRALPPAGDDEALAMSMIAALRSQYAAEDAAVAPEATGEAPEAAPAAPTRQQRAVRPSRSASEAPSASNEAAPRAPRPIRERVDPRVAELRRAERLMATVRRENELNNPEDDALVADTPTGRRIEELRRELGMPPAFGNTSNEAAAPAEPVRPPELAAAPPPPPIEPPAPPTAQAAPEPTPAETANITVPEAQAPVAPTPTVASATPSPAEQAQRIVAYANGEPVTPSQTDALTPEEEAALLAKSEHIRLRQMFGEAPTSENTRLTTEQHDLLQQAAGAETPEAEPHIPGYGNVTEAHGADPNVTYPMQYRVMSLDDLVASHTDALNENPEFPSEVQPRQRDRAASELQINDIVQKFVPNDMLDDGGRLDSGPMIIGPDRVVESGNGRTLALRRMVNQAPEQFARYQQALRDHLARYGLDASDIDGVHNPVLVRERLGEMTTQERAAFADEANGETGLGMSPFEQAVRDATRLPDTLIANLTVGENDTIDRALKRTENLPLLRAFLGMIAPNARAKLVMADGSLNAAGFARLKNAMLVRTFGGEAGERIAKTFIESPDPVVRNVETAMLDALPSLARIEAIVRSGVQPAELSIGNDIAAAVDTLARLRSNGMDVQDYVHQADMWQRETTPFQDSILGFLDANMRRPKSIREAFRAYASALEPVEPGLFGEPTPLEKETVWNAAVREATGVAPEAATQTGAATRQAGAQLAPGTSPRSVPELGRAESGTVGLAQDVNAAENLSPEEQLARLQAENDRLRAEAQQPRARRQLRQRGEAPPSEVAQPRETQRELVRRLRAERQAAAQQPQATPEAAPEATPAWTPAVEPSFPWTPTVPEAAPAAQVAPPVAPTIPTPSPAVEAGVTTPSAAPVTPTGETALPPSEPPAGAPPAATGGTPPLPPGGVPQRQVHTVGAGYWMTAMPETSVSKFREMLDEWAQYSRSGGVRQTQIHAMAQTMGRDADWLQGVIERALKTDTQQAALEGHILRLSLVQSFHDVQTAQARLEDLKALRAHDVDGTTVSNEELDAADATLKAAQSTLELVGTAERRDLESHARALAMARFSVAAGAGADLVEHLEGNLDELNALARTLNSMGKDGQITDDDLKAVRQLMLLIGSEGTLMGGPDESVGRVLTSIRRVLGEQGQVDTPPTAADDKVMVGKSEKLAKDISGNTKRIGETKGAGRRAPASQNGRSVASRLARDVQEKILFLNRQGLTRAEIVNRLTPEERAAIARARSAPAQAAPEAGQRLSRALPETAEPGQRLSRALPPSGTATLDPADDFDFLADVVGAVLDMHNAVEPSRTTKQQRQANELQQVAREIVDLDKQIRRVARTDPAQARTLLEQRNTAAQDLEDMIVQQVDDEGQKAPKGLDPDQIEERIRNQAAQGIISHVTSQLRGPRPADPNQITRTAMRLRDQIVDALRTDGVLEQTPSTLQELSVDLVRINKEQARLRAANATGSTTQGAGFEMNEDGSYKTDDQGKRIPVAFERHDAAARLEPERQAILAQMNDLLRAQALRTLQQTKPNATLLDAERELGRGPLAAIRKSIDEQMRYPQREFEMLGKKLDRELGRNLSRSEVNDIVDRLKEIYDTGRRTYRAADVADDIKAVQETIRTLSVAAQQRAAAIREGLFRANLLRSKKHDDEKFKALRDAMALVDVASPETVGTFLKTLRTPGALEYVQEFAVVNLLTSPMTWGFTGRNFVDNVTRMLYRAVFEVPLAHGARREGRANLAGMLSGAREGWNRGAEIMRQGYLTDDIRRSMMTGDFGQQRPELLGSLPYIGRVWKGAPGKFAWVWPGFYRVSTRPLNAADVMQGHMLYAGAVSHLAEREAGKLLKENPKGYRVPSSFGADETVYSAESDGTGRYKAQARTQLITDRSELRDWILKNLHRREFKHIKEQAGHIEDYSMLRKSASNKNARGLEAWLDRGMSTLANSRYAAPDATIGEKTGAFAMHTALTFFLTGYNASKIAASFTPAGAVYSLGDAVIKRRAGDKARSRELIVKAIMGALLGVGAAWLKDEDWLTGNGPDDPVEYEKWRRTHEPNSLWVVNPTTGKGSWHRLDGLVMGMPLIATANAMEAAESAALKAGKKPGAIDAEIAAMFAIGLAKGMGESILSQSSLQGLSDISNVWKDSKTITSYLANLGLRYGPGVSMARFFATAGDDYMRDPQGLMDFVNMSNPTDIGGGRQGVQTRLNTWGAPIENQQHGLAALDPTRSTRTWGLDDPTIVALNSVGYNVPSAPPSVNNVPLTPAEQRQFTLLAGPKLQVALGNAVNQGWFYSSDPATRSKYLEQIVAPIRKDAATQVLNAIPFDERERRRQSRTVQPVASPELRAS